MFILTRPVKRSGDEPFVPLPPPYDPRTGNVLPGVPFEQVLVRPRIRGGEKNIIPLLKNMDNPELRKYIAELDDKDIVELIRELLNRIKK